ncbi:cyclopropane-fatty-acyl-phospholipid synthase family protein [Arthrobacter sp. AZCC_0090]|uniref:SAM-dependent methyltransferase n=1 Tax=Arthrobacter sp. AZCC_0090 TaxID=2735881 RepID=UPI0016090427|nr:class I SAM-dependent methyltransferase [Arthrobacter sp. AZCC_0090]MBB6405222.1 SAM-dependent methyltransferase [Arthrobacter sp. AZCC_0090]
MTHQHDGGAHLHNETHHDGDAAQFWDEVYREKAKRWSGNPNPQLIAEATGLVPGTALDLGCGEGADAIWLAQHGWTVTAVDVSAVALERAAAHAADVGIQDGIAWLRRDFASWHPEEGFDLVSSQFLHSPILPWRDSLASAAAAVAPGGALLVVGHHPDGLTPWSGHKDMKDKFFTPEDLVEALTRGPGSWRINVADSRERVVTGPEGQQATTIDSVLRATRRS